MSGPTRKDLRGTRHGTWVLVYYEGDGFWRSLCRCGRKGRVFTADIKRGKGVTCRRCASDAMEAATPTYRGMHKRVERQRGPASSQWCSICDAPAKEWSYRHDDPDELHEAHIDRSGRIRMLAYSPDSSHYDPLCKPCHRARDRRSESHATPRAES